MATLFGSLPSAGVNTRSRNSATSTALTTGSAGGSINGERPLQWVYDEDTPNCMLCNTQFTLITRKHHCRRCGNVICHNCSPHKRRIAATDPFPMRVCNTCYAAVDEHFASLEWSGHSATEVPTKADPVIEGRVHIGQLYVKVVEAIGLPSTDSITSDPFVRVLLTGKWSHGQEWGNDLKSIKCTKKKSRTLNPRWHETFVFNVCAPGAELVFEVYNYGQLSQPTKLGEASIAVSELMDQRRHNKWLDLNLSEKLHRPGVNNDARAGRLHVLLHYKFSRMAEFCSYFAAEQPYVVEWPPFQAAHLYSSFWVLLDDLWPYLEVVWQVIPTLNWEHPTHSFMCFALCVWLCLSLQWVPVVAHLALIAFTLRNYFELNLHAFSEPVAPASSSLPGLVPPAGSSSDDGTASSASSATHNHFRQYNLPTGFNHLMNKMTHVTIDLETKRTLQSVQNNMAWWSSILHSIEMMFSWEDTFYTAKVLVLLIVSCVLHIVVPNKFLLLALVLYLFGRWTVPFQWVAHCLWALGQATRSLLHQQRLTSRGHASDLRRETSASAASVSSSDKSRARRTLSSASMRAHHSVSKKEEMFGAAASLLSERFAANDEARASARRA